MKMRIFKKRFSPVFLRLWRIILRGGQSSEPKKWIPKHWFLQWSLHFNFENIPWERENHSSFPMILIFLELLLISFGRPVRPPLVLKWDSSFLYITIHRVYTFHQKLLDCHHRAVTQCPSEHYASRFFYRPRTLQNLNFSHIESVFPS